ncbi:tetratricopeptide repeat protein [Myxococcota bacterium]|nr:tetratricopeptide repeat protein [Myxococcota bacterium]
MNRNVVFTRVFTALGVVAMTACAARQKEVKSATTGGDTAGQASGVQATETPGVELDQASKDFQAEAALLEPSVAKGKVDWEDVVSSMEGVARKHPGYGLAWYNLGVAYEQLGKPEQAENAYKRAVKASVPVREAQENLAAMAVKRGDHGEALSMLKELAARDPNAGSARAVMAQQALAKGDLAGAEKLGREALGRDPTNVSSYCVLAQVAVKKKNFRRARLLAAQGFKLDADAACLHHALGLVALAEGETAVALVSFEKATAKDPRHVDARFQIAQISMGFKDFKKAIESYGAVTQIDPKAPAAWVNLGVALKGSGQFAEAEKAYLKAIEVAGAGGIAQAHYNLGVLYLRNLDRNDDAKAQLKRYLQLADSDESAFQMIEEIDQRKALAEEAKRQEEEQKRQEELDAKVAAEEAKRKAEKEAEEAAERKREEEIERKAREAGEPVDPSKGGTAGEPDKADDKKSDKKGDDKKDAPKPKVRPKKPEPSDPAPKKDFE